MLKDLFTYSTININTFCAWRLVCPMQVMYKLYQNHR